MRSTIERRYSDASRLHLIIIFRFLGRIIRIAGISGVNLTLWLFNFIISYSSYINKKLPSLRLQQKILLMCLMPFMLLVIFFVPYISINIEKSYLENSQKLLYEEVLQYSDEMKRKINKIKNDATLLANVIQYNTQEVSGMNLHNLIRGIFKAFFATNNSLVNMCYYHDSNHAPFLCAADNAIPHDIMSSYSLNNSEDSLIYYNDKPYLLFKITLLDHMKGVLMLFIDLKAIAYDAFINYRFDYISVLDSSGHNIFSYNNSGITAENDMDVLIVRKFLANMTSKEHLNIQNHHHMTSLVTTSLDNNVPIIFLTKRIMLDMYQEVFEFIAVLLLYMLLFIVIAFAVAFFVAMQISTPLVNGIKALESISKGHLNIDLTYNNSSDEIGLMTRVILHYRDSVNQLMHAKQLAEEASRAKTEFLTYVSHEFRTPMHAILSYANLGISQLQEHQEKLNKYFTNILISSNRLLKLVNNLLNLSRLEAGKMHLALQLHSLRECIDAAIAEVLPLAMEKHIKITVNGLDEERAIKLDFHCIVQVLLNIIFNAVKYSPIHGEIIILVTEHHGYIRISIIDQGMGIAAHELQSVFESFHTSGHGDMISTGLGLSIAKKIINMHGGTIWAANQEQDGKILGAMIHFTLPDHQQQQNA